MSRQTFLDKIEKTFGNKSGLVVKDPAKISIEKFPTGSLFLDIFLKGGYPKGTMIEPFGWEQSGKTTSAIEAAVKHQKKYPDEIILWIDLERVFDSVYFAALGLDLSPEKFILLQPDSGEEAYTTMLDFVAECFGGLIVVDSVPSLLSAKEDAKDMGDPTISLAARLNSEGVRKLVPKMNKNKTTIFFINQLRANIGGMQKNITTGGNSFRFYSRTRLNYASGQGDFEDTIKIYAKLAKANYGHEGSSFETVIAKNRGFDTEAEIILLGVECGVLERSGAWYSYDGTKIGQGREGAKQLLLDNPELTEKLEAKIRAFYLTDGIIPEAKKKKK